MKFIQITTKNETKDFYHESEAKKFLTSVCHITPVMAEWIFSTLSNLPDGFAFTHRSGEFTVRDTEISPCLTREEKMAAYEEIKHEYLLKDAETHFEPFWEEWASLKGEEKPDFEKLVKRFEKAFDANVDENDIWDNVISEYLAETAGNSKTPEKALAKTPETPEETTDDPGYIDNTLVHIFEEKGVKYVQFIGYGYWCESSDVVDDSGAILDYRFVEYRDLIATLKTVLAAGGLYYYEGEYGSEVQQYSTDCTEEGCVQLYKDAAKEPLKLVFEGDITPEIPCGWYAVKGCETFSFGSKHWCRITKKKKKSEFENSDFKSFDSRMWELVKEYASHMGVDIYPKDPTNSSEEPSPEIVNSIRDSLLALFIKKHHDSGRTEPLFAEEAKK